jgi:NAD(P)-dependent dehydrogenase (short-subunit alcohol dehydrogenase family)
MMQQKIAVITGGSRGLGRSAALRVAARGVGVVLTYRSRKAEADAVVAAIEAAGGRAAALPLDVGERASFAAFAAALAAVLAARWQRQDFDFLVNNAGEGAFAAFAETSPEDFERLMRVHLMGPFFLTQTLLPHLADGGRILNVSSGLTRVAMPGFAAYAMMKGGIEVMTRYLAKELGARRITVNAIAPGAIATDFGGGQVRDDASLNAFFAAQTALGRVGMPDDIGGLVAALLAEETGWVNAERIEASGGWAL